VAVSPTPIRSRMQKISTARTKCCQQALETPLPRPPRAVLSMDARRSSALWFITSTHVRTERVYELTNK